MTSTTVRGDEAAEFWVWHWRSWCSCIFGCFNPKNQEKGLKLVFVERGSEELISSERK